jgi:hypothetical protein
VPGCYEAAILVEAVLRGILTPATRGNTGNQEAAPTSGMVFVYEVGNDIERFTAGSIKFSSTRNVHGGNAMVTIQVARTPQAIEPRHPNRGPYRDLSELWRAINEPASLDLAAVKWDERSAGWDWLRETVGANHQAFPVSIRGGLVKKVFTTKLRDLNKSYTVVSFYNLKDAWPGAVLSVPSTIFPFLAPSPEVLNGLPNSAHVLNETAIYNMNIGPENCAEHAATAANAYNYGFAMAPPIPAVLAVAAPAPPTAALVGIDLSPHQPAISVLPTYHPQPYPYQPHPVPAAPPAPFFPTVNHVAVPDLNLGVQYQQQLAAARAVAPLSVPEQRANQSMVRPGQLPLQDGLVNGVDWQAFFRVD